MSTELVTVKGLGHLPEHMQLTYEDINFTLPPSANKHNEANVNMACEEETGPFNDTLTFYGDATKIRNMGHDGNCF